MSQSTKKKMRPYALRVSINGPAQVVAAAVESFNRELDRRLPGEGHLQTRPVTEMEGDDAYECYYLSCDDERWDAFKRRGEEMFVGGITIDQMPRAQFSATNH